MQRRVIKILIILAISFFGSDQFASAQVLGYRLKQADSLFQAKRYVQSLEHYETILEQKQYTPSMLLKMAFIHEGLGRIGPALYCLNLYYTRTHDQAVSDKMEELAAKFSLKGYEYSDRNKIFSLYQQYSLYISFALIAIAIFLMSLVLFLRRKKSHLLFPASVLVVILIGFMVHVNVGQFFSTGIVSSPHTYVMAGPSPGADVITVLEEGHRFTVLGRKDVWLKIKWNGANAFVKENNLLML
ncbi:MAG TPA: SH3 domain-containing protein [Chryseolinea sp.]|nr:SH3 domain-containing protein [Chryseolinea sp.]HPM29786.1 SH3 domain-containing protein [Chryseolinea sp.]